MSAFVIDASAALAWLVRTQATPASAAFLADRDQDDFVAPHIFSWEVGNVLLSLYRRRAISVASYGVALDELAALEISVQSAPTEREIRELGQFARTTGLTLFDAAYVALALERDARLVSRDNDLLVAAAGCGVACIDLRVEFTA